MRKIIINTLLSTAIFLCIQRTYAQSSSFLGDGVQDHIRLQQLLGKVGQENSLMARSFLKNYRALDSLLPGWKAQGSRKKKIISSEPVIEYLPVSSTFQLNTDHAYASNDGSMIPSKGFQTTLSAGLIITTGKFSLQFKPEFVYTPNKAFETFPTEHSDNYWANYYQQLNNIDMPERFGSKRFMKFFPGQSSIRFTSGAISAGFSTENIWWGPGKFNALIMGSNAPGFPHITFDIVKPIITNIGTFEGQLISGLLTSSGFFPPDSNRYYNGVRLYKEKHEESRYITGLTMSWQPKWVKGLFFGFSSAAYLYKTDISGPVDILPLQGLIISKTEKAGHKAILGGLFARYVMPAERAELYFEFGRNDKVASLINVIAESDYPRAYVAGFSKLFPARKKGRFIEFSAEFTQLELPTAKLIQEAVGWYMHPYVRQGFTNQGQVLGASIGPGSNSLQLDFNLLKGFNKIGLRIERLAHNEDFYYNAFPITNDFTRHWIDISTTLHAKLQIKKKLLLYSELALVRSLNYQWYILPGLGYFKNGYDKLNIHASISLSYRL